ncbi:MAG: DUF4215 domain-containing protein, partial [Deltaproteobacteria bacterium]|nr:DUF4215 domain-containing protein [Deltaproteobacteria bacterium]
PGDGCSATCTIEPRCGNGQVENNEECDDGNLNNFDLCTNACECYGPQCTTKF